MSEQIKEKRTKIGDVEYKTYHRQYMYNCLIKKQSLEELLARREKYLDFLKKIDLAIEQKTTDEGKIKKEKEEKEEKELLAKLLLKYKQ
jgi:hypothetical protein